MRLRILAAVVFAGCSSAAPIDRASAAPEAEELRVIARCASADADPRISVTSSFRDTREGAAIHFRFKNVSSGPLHIYPFALPWGNVNSLDVAALSARGKLLPLFSPIDDPSFEDQLVLPPSETREGDVVLSDRIPDLESARVSDDVVVLWCYRLYVQNEEGARCASGVLVVPKTAKKLRR